MQRNIMFALMALVISLGVASVFASDISDVKVTFRTMTCQGVTGFASVNADYVHNIVETKCEPKSRVEKVHQVMIKKASSGASINIFTVSEKEAEMLMQKIEAYQDDKRKSLRDSNRYILEK